MRWFAVFYRDPMHPVQSEYTHEHGMSYHFVGKDAI